MADQTHGPSFWDDAKPSTRAVYGILFQDRVWALADLEVLHLVDRPLLICKLGQKGDPVQPGAEELIKELYFQNLACVNLMGKAQPVKDYTALINAMPERERSNQRSWTDIIKKAIQVQLAPGHVITATLLEFEPEMTTQNARITAMHQYNPIYRFMCNEEGIMVHANKLAWEAYSTGTDVAPTLMEVFARGEYAGGVQEVHAAYHEAVSAIFDKRVACHRHQRCYTSKKTGKQKWTTLEMWPIADPLDGKLAVMVSEYNMTQQKELELQLAAQHCSLQRQNAELETLNADIQTEKEQLLQQNTHLTERLEAVAKSPTPGQGINADTPLDLMLNMLQRMIMGDTVGMTQILDLRHILTESTTDLRQPIGLERQLLESSHSTDDEVGLSMLQLLKGKSVKQPNRPDSPGANSDDKRRPGLRRLSSRSSFEEQATHAHYDLAAVITPAVERLLQDATKQWQFDILGFAEATPGHTLSLMGFYILKSQGFVSEFKLDEAKLCMYLRRIEQGYDDSIPYHNCTHVASVLQMTHMLMVHGGVMKSRGADRLSLLASYVAALVHDFEHSGVNNDFLIKTSHDLAITYNLQSPLENHHLAASTRVFLQKQYQFLGPVSQEDRMALRTIAIDQVLGTDMKKHFSVLSRFQALFKRTTSTGTACSAAEGHSSLADLKSEDRSTLHQMVLKCADIGHLAADTATHKRWSLKLEEEFFRQGDMEKALGLSVSPLMDRTHKGGITRSQIGFFSIVGIPMYKAMVSAFEDAGPLLDGVMANYKCWEAAAASGKDPRT
ncbi:hypothetical protein WJX77_003173 [Trebouxia sp. C0004]